MEMKVILGGIYFLIVAYLVMGIFNLNWIPLFILDFDKWIISAGAVIIFYEGWKYFKKPADSGTA